MGNIAFQRVKTNTVNWMFQVLDRMLSLCLDIHLSYERVGEGYLQLFKDTGENTAVWTQCISFSWTKGTTPNGREFLHTHECRLLNLSYKNKNKRNQVSMQGHVLEHSKLSLFLQICFVTCYYYPCFHLLSWDSCTFPLMQNNCKKKRAW